VEVKEKKQYISRTFLAFGRPWHRCNDIKMDFKIIRYD
jgi:hypothetical protein